MKIAFCAIGHEALAISVLSAIAKKEGLIQKNDEAELALIIEKIIFENKKVVDEYKAGKLSALQFLVGQCMKETKGAANPAVLKGLILRVI